ncbi:MAG: alr [Verrucomicrobiaceae bacterium]|nr:alr [Verrucomicrobiaceae bacterium]
MLTSEELNRNTAAFADVLRPTRVEVDLSRLAANLSAIRSHVGQAKVMPVLKANAYGHGLIEVALLMVELGADYLGAAFLEEGLLLRNQGITTPILILGGLAGEQIPLFLKNSLTLTASSVDKLRQINEVAAALGTRAKVHLKIDTGMERVGVHYYSAEKLLEASLECSRVEVEGIYSHFANADAQDLSHARLQLERFQEVLQFYERRSLPTPVRHMANSAGILQLPDSHLDMVRPGIMLYGIYPSPECRRTVAVAPALQWRSQVSFFKVVQPGHPVSYGSTWQTDHPVRVVTMPVGYGDGYFRALSNRGQVLIRGRRYPIAGRVCMDQMMANIEWDSAFNGDAVTLIGTDGDQTITADDVAGWAGTIPYEVLTNINTRVPRVYVGTEAACKSTPAGSVH